jgi:hypothetical protein
MWATPQDFYDELALEFDFEVDVCAIAGNAKCPLYYSPQDDSLCAVSGLSKVKT